MQDGVIEKERKNHKKEQKNHFKNFAFLKSKARKNHKRSKRFQTLESTSIFLQTNWRFKENNEKFLNLVEASAKAT